MADKVLMLALSPTMEKGTIARWAVPEGGNVKSGDVLCEVETDKATMDYESGVAGTLLKIIVPAGGEAAVGDLIAIVGKPGEDISALLDDTAAETPSAPSPEAAPAASSTPTTAQPPPTDIAPDHVKASPLARKLAEQAGLTLSRIHGSGPGGRIVRRDVESALAAGTTPAAPTPVAAPAPAPAAGDTLVPLSQKRRIIAQRLSESKFTAPHYYLKVRAVADALMAARAKLNADRPDKISVNAFLIKLCAEALRRHKQVNAGWQGDRICLFGRVDIGLAVALPDGLLTPVVRDCVGKGIVQIDQELRDLIEKARANRLTPEQFTGASFTISNLGSFGIEEFTAIINPPGSAILAVGAITREALPDAYNTIRIAGSMRLTLSCDHRVIDGAVGAAFLSDLKDFIENPLTLLS